MCLVPCNPPVENMSLMEAPVLGNQTLAWCQVTLLHESLAGRRWIMQVFSSQRCLSVHFCFLPSPWAKVEPSSVSLPQARGPAWHRRKLCAHFISPGNPFSLWLQSSWILGTYLLVSACASPMHIWMSPRQVPPHPYSCAAHDQRNLRSLPKWSYLCLSLEIYTEL